MRYITLDDFEGINIHDPSWERIDQLVAVVARETEIIAMQNVQENQQVVESSTRNRNWPSEISRLFENKEKKGILCNGSSSRVVKEVPESSIRKDKVAKYARMTKLDREIFLKEYRGTLMTGFVSRKSNNRNDESKYLQKIGEDKCVASKKELTMMRECSDNYLSRDETLRREKLLKRPMTRECRKNYSSCDVHWEEKEDKCVVSKKELTMMRECSDNYLSRDEVLRREKLLKRPMTGECRNNYSSRDVHWEEKEDKCVVSKKKLTMMKERSDNYSSRDEVLRREKLLKRPMTKECRNNYSSRECVESKKELTMMRERRDNYSSRDEVLRREKLLKRPMNEVQRVNKRKRSITSDDEEDEEKFCVAKKKKIHFKFKKKKERNEDADEEPELPESFKNRIDKLAEKEGKKVKDLKLIIQKKVYQTDVSGTHNRLSIPKAQIKARFLSVQEEKYLCMRYDEKTLNSINVRVIEPCLKIRELELRRWEMHKGKKGSKKSVSFVLNAQWNDTRRENNIREGDRIQVWMVRMGDDNELIIVIVKLPKLQTSDQTDKTKVCSTSEQKKD